MNERIKELAEQATKKISFRLDPNTYKHIDDPDGDLERFEFDKEKFAELIAQDCIDKIETYRIPVGNSSSGELACEWTYAALKEIRDEIKEHFGVEK